MAVSVKVCGVFCSGACGILFGFSTVCRSSRPLDTSQLLLTCETPSKHPLNSYTPIDALLLPEWIIYWDRKFGFVGRGSLQYYSLLALLQTLVAESKGYEVLWFARILMFSRFCWSHPLLTTERNSYLKANIIVKLWKYSEILLCLHARLLCRASQSNPSLHNL